MPLKTKRFPPGAKLVILILISGLWLHPAAIKAQQKLRPLSDTAILSKQISLHRKNDTTKIKLYYELCDLLPETRFDNPDGYFNDITYYSLTALKLSIALNWEKGILACEPHLNRIYLYSKLPPRVSSLFKDVVALANALPESDIKYKIYQYIGINYFLVRNSLAADYFNHALVYFRQKKNNGEMANTLGYLLKTQLMLGKRLRRSSLDSAIVLAKTSNNFSVIARLSEYTAEFIARTSEDEALPYYKTALSAAIKAGDLYNQLVSEFFIGYYYYDKKDYVTALAYFKEGAGWAAKSSDAFANPHLFLQAQAGVFIQQHQYKLAESTYAKSLSEARTNRDFSLIYDQLSSYYLIRANYLKAIEADEKRLKYIDKTNGSYDTEYIYQSIGNIYAMIDNTDKAFAYYSKAYQIELAEARSYKEKYTNPELLCSIGSLYINSDPGKALVYFNRALAISDSTKDRQALMMTRSDLGAAWYNLGDHSRAFRLSKQAIKDSTDVNYNKQRAQSFRILGSVVRDAADSLLINNGIKVADRYKVSLDYLDHGLAILANTSVPEAERDQYKELSHTYYLQKNFEGAYHSYAQYIMLRDSVNNRHAIGALEQRQAGILFSRKSDSLKFLQQAALIQVQKQKLALQLNHQQLDLANKNKALQQSILQKEQAEVKISRQETDAARTETNYRKSQSRYFIAGITALILLSFFIARNYFNQRKANKEISRQKTAAEENFHQLKETQKQLIQSEKMASLGELTAGIAHEIQNPLNFVNNFSDVNREMIDEVEEELRSGNIDEALAILADIKGNEVKINHHGKRADSIVKGMLEHSRTSSGKKQPTDINKLTDEYLRLAYHGLRAKNKSFNADLVTNYASDLPLINILAQDIGRVMLNLFNNAFYATQQQKLATGGDLKPVVTVITSVSESSVQISVKDNGVGIPADIKEKIMQPFFTTKPTGKGTGLGLSLSYDIIVKAHSGSIEVQSTPGNGSTFTIKLPIS